MTRFRERLLPAAVAALAACSLTGALGLGTIDDAFTKRYTAVDLGPAARALSPAAAVGPSRLGLVRWAGATRLEAPRLNLAAGDVIKIKARTDAGPQTVEVEVGGRSAGTLDLDGAWRQFELRSPGAGHALALVNTSPRPLPVHLSRISVSNVAGASSGPLTAFLRTSRRGPPGPRPAAVLLLPFLVAALVTLGERFAGRAAWPRATWRAAAAVIPALAVLAAARILAAAHAAVLVMPGRTFALVVTGSAVLASLTAHFFRSLATARSTPRRIDVRTVVSPAELTARRNGMISGGRVRPVELLLPAVVATLLILLFFAALLRAGADVPVAPGDGWLQNLPGRFVLGEALRQGRLPLWNPYIFGGFPLLGDPQVGALYPLNWLAGILPLGLAFNLALGLSLLLALVFTYGLARSHALSPPAALVAGVTFGFSGMLIGNLGLTNLVEATAWLPAAAWATHRLVLTGSRRWGVVLGLALALQFLAGHTQTSAYTVIAVAAVLAAVFARARTGDRRRIAAATAAGAVTALVLVLPQLAATAQLTAESSRTALSYADFRTGHAEVRHLLLFAVPYFLKDHSAGATWSELIGISALCLAWLGWHQRRRGDGAGPWGWVVAGSMAMAMAPGNAVLGRVLFHVPLLNAFRVSDRWQHVALLGLAVLTGFGVQRLLETPTREARRRNAAVLAQALAAILLVAGVAVAAGAWGGHWGMKGAGASLVAWVNRPAWTAAVLTGAVVAWLALGRSPRIAAGAAACILLFELAAFNSRAEWLVRLPRLAACPDPTATALAPASRRVRDDLARTGGRVVTLYTLPDWGTSSVRGDLDVFEPNVNVFQHVANVNGYSPLIPRRLHEWAAFDLYGGQVPEDVIPRWVDPASRLPDVLAARWVALPEASAPRPAGAPAPLAVDGIGGAEHRYALVPRASAMPRAWFAGRAVIVPEATLRAWLQGGAGAPPADPSDTVLVLDSDAAGLGAPGNGTSGTVAVRSSAPGAFTAEVDTAGSGWLVLSESWAPGWAARVDGGAWRPTLPAYGLIQAVAVPAGRHRVELAYRPKAVWAALAVAGLGALGALVVVAGAPRRRRRPLS